ncbi:1,6-anhydro-N-acetylmuramyl-L-alanine amidase AmpD [Serratia ficaria]|uniref:1,6-anhydro-N-acetylmuramyl-L-alanine amidase AmpD n=1 Tax=Serratia ficaria TaxID=61651 RepID=A0A240B0I5_SERFI|nr:1,6-anhydro-N-acetylmuramyl-L-alanine amidase AmpD [Serratia ficaria]MEE4482445.1 1,6-anhydro-N-acetylmuramyl-L-alanine amidase AmpD [Serratia ficaria]REF46362.1 AmpD protein [Serratia ficaria]CAI0931389.1 1,6-anhydro-N-acetylmuramyl-L-alanine amidase AmpD [Serratia ficaria]CAI0977635.1 1,6-anhydro-N-acetylmuramyl-L-alanine amidase AmpD [Serratia ficaria]CAI0985878.1 1,6-anhydro-N-acetylmuramyl-L-alanine amidase AmpD [Serratia ficaria]
MQLENGWIVGVTRVVSPHCDRRPDDEPPSLLVIHNISLPPGEFGGPYIDRLFTGTLDPADHPYFAAIHQLRVSAHCLIRRDGEIVQYVPFDRRAWHAGVSAYRGREKCNDFSIGIELEGTDLLPYTPQQYHGLQAVSALLIGQYPSLAAHIAGHSDIAPGRKTDPGPAFDWDRYLASLEQREGAANAMLEKRKRERSR